MVTWKVFGNLADFKWMTPHLVKIQCSFHPPLVLERTSWDEWHGFHVPDIHPVIPSTKRNSKH